jgi:hypothetical protein
MFQNFYICMPHTAGSILATLLESMNKFTHFLSKDTVQHNIDRTHVTTQVGHSICYKILICKSKYMTKVLLKTYCSVTKVNQ